MEETYTVCSGLEITADSGEAVELTICEAGDSFLS